MSSEKSTLLAVLIQRDLFESGLRGFNMHSCIEAFSDDEADCAGTTGRNGKQKPSRAEQLFMYIFTILVSTIIIVFDTMHTQVLR